MNGDFFSSLVFATVAHSALISLANAALRGEIVFRFVHLGGGGMYAASVVPTPTHTR